MIKIKYIFDFLIFPLKSRYFGYNKTIGSSPSIEALSPLLEDICNCGKKKNSWKKSTAKYNFGAIFGILVLSCQGFRQKTGYQTPTMIETTTSLAPSTASLSGTTKFSVRWGESFSLSTCLHSTYLSPVLWVSVSKRTF